MPGEVLPGKQHLHQRMVRHRPGRIQPLHQYLKRHILMLEGRQAAPPHLGEQFGDGGIACQIDPQHQGVDEEPDQLIERRIIAPGDREPHRHIAAGAQPRQQHRQRGLHHHEAGRVAFRGHLPHPLLQLRRPVHQHPRTTLISHRRIRPIAWQLQPLGHSGQRVLPIRQLRSDQTLAVIEITEPRTLPQRVIDVLHRQFSQPTSPAGAPSGVGVAQITHQWTDRPAVGRDMVRHAHQHVVVISDAEKPCPQGNLSSQIECVSPRFLDGLAEAVGRTIRWRRRHPNPTRRAQQAPPPAGGFRRAPRSRCAGFRGGPPHRSAPRATRRDRGVRADVTPPACCKPLRGPAIGR